ncbi:MAG: hypothetical protein O7F14_13215 [Alphaproteobacteria bacterium]|nr:hypothetical protein [Alphaproteobacteria bacterium]
MRRYWVIIGVARALAPPAGGFFASFAPGVGASWWDKDQCLPPVDRRVDATVLGADNHHPASLSQLPTETEGAVEKDRLIAPLVGNSALPGSFTNWWI